MVDLNYVPKATVYEQEGQVGVVAELPTHTTVPDLSRIVHHHNVLSAKITGGWIFYANSDFNLRADAHVEYYYGTYGTDVSLKSFGGHIGSVRYVDTSQDTRDYTMTFYSRHQFQGLEQLIRDAYTNVNVEVSSFVITGTASWTVYDEPDFKGKSITFKPKHSTNFHPAFVGDVTHFEIYPNTIKSVRQGDGGDKFYEV